MEIGQQMARMLELAERGFVYCSTIHDSQDMESTYVPINRRKEMWHIYPMEYNSALNKKEIMSYAAQWMELKVIMLSKLGTEKYCTFSLIHES